MPRFRRVNIDGKSLYKTETRLTAAALQPGTVVGINGSDLFATAGTAPSIMCYVLGAGESEGLTIEEAIPSGHSAVGNYLEEGREFAVAVAAGTYTKDQALTIIAGKFAAIPVAAGTYRIYGYVQEPDGPIVLAAPDFIRIRVRASSIVVA